MRWMLVRPSGHAEMPVITEGLNCTAHIVLRAVEVRGAMVSEKLVQTEDRKKASNVWWFFHPAFRERVSGCVVE